MSALVDHHPLARDLPELKASIHALKMTDAHFVHELDAYEALDKEIVRIEQGVESRSDDELEPLKVRRVHLKDALHRAAAEHARRGALST